jgi:hypothetical protein
MLCVFFFICLYIPTNIPTNIFNKTLQLVDYQLVMMYVSRETFVFLLVV